MEEKELISIVVPVYNVKQYLPACIDSMLAQTYRNLEIILVDDGATDGSGEICDQYMEKDKRIRVIHKPNGGVSSARNAGIDAATGALIGFVDSDDTIAPEMYQTLYSDICQYSADIAHCGCEIIWNGRVQLRNGTGECLIYERDQGLRELLAGRKIEPSLCNKLYRVELFQNIRLNENVCVNEDFLANYYLFSGAKRTVFHDVCLYHYIHREGSCTMSGFGEKKLDQITVARMIKADMENRFPELRDYGTRRLVSALISVYNHSLPYSEYGELRENIVSELKRMRRKIIKGKVFGDSQKVAVAIMTTFPGVYRAMLWFRNRRYRYGASKADKEWAKA